jgi:SNF2 family DNA or RNA helicase
MGGQSQRVRDEMKQDFIDGKIKYVVMVVKAGGTGTDGLQFATRNIGWLSVDDSRIENEQALARGVRRGQGDLVRIRRIMAIDTYDLGILDKQTEDAVAINRSMRGVA